MSRLSSSAGIAIGPILFVVALLGVLTVAMSSNMGSFSSIGTADRVTADIVSQANLIRAKFNECAMRYGTTSDNNYGYPAGVNLLVSAATCSGIPTGSEKNLWTGLHQTMLPRMTEGFDDWRFTNDGSTGGRCFWTAPTSGAANTGIVMGLKNVARKYSTQELNYDTGASQKIIFYITHASGTPHANCPEP